MLVSAASPSRRPDVTSLFARIYLGLIVAMLLIAGAVLATLSLIESSRETSFRESVLSVPLQLIADGIGRHQGEDRERWIDIAARLLNAELRVEPEDAPPSRVVVEHVGEQQYRARIALPGSPKHQVVLLFQNWTEQQWRATTHFLLNELGRHPADQQRATLERLAADLPYPLRHLSLEQAGLDERQRERIKTEVVMQTEWRDSGRPSTRFFAPYGLHGDVLAVGPVPSPAAMPLAMTLSVIGVAALAFAAIALWMVRTLERRLQQIDAALARFGTANFELGDLGPNTDDAIGRLAQTVRGMAKRIHGLLRTQQELIQGVSHDLRTPVARVRLRLEMLNPEPGPQRDRADGIRRDLDELESLIDAAITYSQLDDAGARLRQEPMDLGNELRRLVKDQSLLAPGIAVELHVPDGASRLSADRSLLRRALQNLLGNALRYASKRVEVQLQAAAGILQIAVDDDGPGVPEAQRERIFEPFSRLDETRSKSSGGYGLGLAIVRRIAECHGGRIDCVASPLGGARFQLQLPLGASFPGMAANALGSS